jgi:hypothetical protein
MSILEKLTEGIVNRDLRAEGDALLSKWEKTGLLEGLSADHERAGMARLLENQAKQLLKEASSMAAGDVEGFASVAFPLVRRVFGGLLANDIVSVQPMSLPSGLIFFLDFTYEESRLGFTGSDGTAESIYGGGIVGSQLTGGVSDLTEDGGGLYNLQAGYSAPTASTAVATASAGQPTFEVGASATTDKLIRFDPDLASGSFAQTVTIPLAQLPQLNRDMLVDVVVSNANTIASGSAQVRRLTTTDGTNITVVFHKATTFGTVAVTNTTVTYPITDDFQAGGAIGSVVGDDTWGLEEPLLGTGNFGSNTDKNEIPEIDIKVDSIAVTATTRKLKAKWSPELGQDLNAYHNLDAEVELTSILSEQIALEIDREILNDLIAGATAGKYYWSRSPGLFVNRTTGVEVGAGTTAPDFTGTVSEWYETLIETINDVSAQIHRKTLRGGANFIVTSPEVANILEFTSGFRASVTADADTGTVGAVNVGSLSKKFDVYVDPYFPRNVVLVGRKGSGFLESGYVYAPYVPLQVTPTIFGTEDFVPRKGVMTRYAKQMVRPDMYGLVICRGLLGESGS